MGKINFEKTINKLFIFVGIGVIAHMTFLLLTTDAKTLSEITKLRYPYLIVIAILAMLPWVFHSLRMMLWTKFIGYPLGFRDCINVIVANDLGSALTPTAVGGGPVKFAMLRRKGLDSAKASFIVLLSGTEDAMFYLIGVLLGAYYLGDSFIHFFDNISENSTGLSTIPIVIIFLVFLKVLKVNWWTPILNLLPNTTRLKISKWGKILKNTIYEIAYNFVEVYKRGKLRLILSLSLLISQWISKFSILMVLLKALNIEVPYLNVLINQWIIWMSMLFIPTPGASGGAEAAFLLMFKNKISGEAITLITSTWRFFTYYFIVILSIIIFQMIMNKRSAGNEINLSNEVVSVES